MGVITISRQMGSQGCEIANLVADRLGYRLVWRELINQAARRAGTPIVALAAIDELGLLDISPTPTAFRSYQKAIKQVLVELAQEGNIVIVGRAGQVILGDFPNSIHVQVTAPEAIRAQRIAQRHAIPLDCAEAQIKSSDLYRKNYMRRFYNVRWDDPQLYHIIINTGRVKPGQAFLIICQTLRDLESNEAAESHQKVTPS